MTTINDIKSVDWQPKIGEIGAVVEGLDDIHQCIRIILTTPKGSVPHNPLFGSDIWRYLDYPVNEVIPHLIREAVDNIEAWEPRIQLIGIQPVVDGATITLQVEWQPIGSDENYTTEVTLNAAA